MNENRKIQELTLGVLETFMKICQKYNLRYYLTGGSLIGVFRHGGFIPWDDDIDICMPREDFEKFHEYIKDDMPEGYGICNRYSNSEWHFGLSQFVDLETEVEIDLAEEKRKANIWIDIFPIDGVPNNPILRWLRIKNVLVHRYIVQIANISTQVDSHRNRPLLEKLFISIFKIIPIGKLVDSNKVIDHMEKVLKKSNFDNSIYAGNLLGRYREREVILQKYYGKPTEHVFEGISVMCPEDSDGFLSSIYGNYMKLPPEDKRVAHNVKIIKCREEQL